LDGYYFLILHLVKTRGTRERKKKGRTRKRRKGKKKWRRKEGEE
jgi:hypothetical protein